MDESNKPTVKEKEHIISNVVKLTSNRNASPKPKPLSLLPSLPLSQPPSPNGEATRQLLTGEYSSPKATTSPCKRKDTPNYEAMDLGDDLNYRTTIIENK